jgi:CHAD domain-containing protein
MPDTLSDHERATLLYFRDHGEASIARRAQIVLLHEQENTSAEIAAAVSLSISWVNHWKRAWNESRLAIFPPVPEPSEPPRPGIHEPRLLLEQRPAIGLQPDDPMSEAGRKVLFYHFERMLLHEPAARLGEDIEGVHDMRVATRRMRSALRLFKPFFYQDLIRPYRKGLRHIGGILGEARDMDVFMDNMQRFVAQNPETDLSPLLEIGGKKQNETHRRLIAHLDSQKFNRFVTRFHEFLTTPELGAADKPDSCRPTAYQVQHLAAPLIYHLFEQVRSYDPFLEDAGVSLLHALRIDFKRLRYALEFFEEVSGPEAKRVIREVKAMQDHLGDLNDAEFASRIVNEFIREHDTKYSGIPGFMRPDITGVITYAAARAAEKRHQLDTFPQLWENFLRDGVRRDLALALSVL